MLDTNSVSTNGTGINMTSITPAYNIKVAGASTATIYGSSSLQFTAVTDQVFKYGSSSAVYFSIGASNKVKIDNGGNIYALGYLWGNAGTSGGEILNRSGGHQLSWDWANNTDLQFYVDGSLVVSIHTDETEADGSMVVTGT